jgi:hypothetical protein
MQNRLKILSVDHPCKPPWRSAPDGKTLALVEYATLDGGEELKLIDFDTGVVRLAHKFPSRSLPSLTFTPLVITRPDRDAVKLWEVMSGAKGK